MKLSRVRPSALPAIVAALVAVSAVAFVLRRPSEPAPSGAEPESRSGARSLPAAARVDGSVLDAWGQPLAGATVSLWTGSAWLFAGTTDEEGRAVLPVALDALSNDLRRYSDSIGVPLRVVARGHAGHETAVTLDAGRTSRLGSVALAPGWSLRGTLRTPDGTPVADARVLGIPEDYEQIVQATRPDETAAGLLLGHAFVAEARTDAQGAFCLDNLRSGGLYVVPLAPGMTNEGDVLRRVGAGADTNPIDVVVHRVPAEELVGGRVLDPRGAPVPFADVRVTLEQASWGLAARADAHGAFLVRVPPAGTYTLVARPALGDFEPARATGVRAGNHDLALRLSAHPPQRSGEARIVDLYGRPIPWASIEVVAPDDPSSRAPAWYEGGQRGRATFPLPDGLFQVTALAPGFVPKTAGPLLPEAFSEPLVFELEVGRAVRGFVTYGGRAVTGARLSLSWAYPPGVSTRTSTDDATPFDFLGSGRESRVDGRTDGAGAYTLSLRQDGWHVVIVEARDFPRSVFGPFELRKDTGADIRVALEKGGSIAGHVVGGDPTGVIVGVSDGWGIAYTQEVSADGEFFFQNLHPGRWQVRRCLPPVNDVQTLQPDPGARRDAHGVPRAPREPPRWDCQVLPNGVTRCDVAL